MGDKIRKGDYPSLKAVNDMSQIESYKIPLDSLFFPIGWAVSRKKMNHRRKSSQRRTTRNAISQNV